MDGSRAFLNGIAGYLPGRVLTNADIAERYPKWSGESILEKIGIERRHIAGEHEFVSDMAIKAGEALFASNPRHQEGRDRLCYTLYPIAGFHDSDHGPYPAT